MGSSVCFLITILYRDELMRCALKVERDIIGDDCWQYPMEPENREKLHSLLPLHVKNSGKIVEVQPIFEVAIVDEMPA